MIGDEGWDALYEKISALAAVKANDNEPVTIKDVIDMVAKATITRTVFSQDENGTEALRRK